MDKASVIRRIILSVAVCVYVFVPFLVDYSHFQQAKKSGSMQAEVVQIDHNKPEEAKTLTLRVKDKESIYDGQAFSLIVDERKPIGMGEVLSIYVYRGRGGRDRVYSRFEGDENRFRNSFLTHLVPAALLLLLIWGARRTKDIGSDPA